MKAVLARAAWRHAVRHPWLVLLGVVGVALGIAVVTAIDLTRASATESFENAAAAVTGRATHHLVGGPRGVDESHYVRLRRAALASNLAPVIDTMVGIGEGAATSVWEADWDRPLALVMGSEGKGLHPRVAEACDYLVSIPMRGDAESLNVSVAAGILLFAAVRAREA